MDRVTVFAHDDRELLAGRFALRSSFGFHPIAALHNRKTRTHRGPIVRVALLMVVAGLAFGCAKDSPTEPSDQLSFAGTWRGAAVQAGGPLGPNSTLTLTLSQSARTLTGTGRNEYSGQPPYFIAADLSGTVRAGDTGVDLIAVTTSFNAPAGILPCSNVTLSLQHMSGSPRRLVGTVMGAATCPPATVELTKQ